MTGRSTQGETDWLFVKKKDYVGSKKAQSRGGRCEIKKKARNKKATKETKCPRVTALVMVTNDLLIA